MFAPLDFALSSDSKNIIVQPSAITKPSLSLSNGLDAFSGSLFLEDNARLCEKALMVIPEVADSVPPAMTISTKLFSINLFASPIALAEAAHAVVIVEEGPSIPNFIDVCPVLELGII